MCIYILYRVKKYVSDDSETFNSNELNDLAANTAMCHVVANRCTR